MKTTELKKIIRTMVRECVNEMLAEKFIERSINEMTGTGSKKRSLREEVVQEDEDDQPEPPKKKPKRKPIVEGLNRAEIIKKYGLDEGSPMVQMYEDTMKNNPYINGTAEFEDPPGTISENALKKSGIMDKDWTKYF